MNRKEFLEKIGIGAAFALTSTCLGGCSSSENNNNVSPAQATKVDFTVDLTNQQNAIVKTVGNYIIRHKVVIAKSSDNNYYAATQLCSHEDLYKVIFKDNEWFCTEHQARFDKSGKGLNDNGSKGLTIYKTELNGEMLRIYS